MGGGLSRQVKNPPTPPDSSDKRLSQSKIPTSIDARIVKTLQEMNATRRQAAAKVKSLNFERIVLKFGMAREAFHSLHTIYNQFVNVEKDGLDYEGLKAALRVMGAEMNESDMREIFYESDMVRDESLSQNEFIVSLAISHLLGLITSYDSISRNLVLHVPEDAATPRDSQGSISVRDGSVFSIAENSPEMIANALDLMVTAYLLFDDDGSGTIQTNEVRNIMQKHSHVSRRNLERKSSGMTTKAIRNERIKELDINQDGTITFQEFVLTFQKWVGVDD